MYQQAAAFVAKYDRNQDQQLSDIEARKSKQAADFLVAGDANRDNQLTVDELYDHAKQQQAEANGKTPKVEFLPDEKLKGKNKPIKRD
jgi:hypothetical protein